MILAPWLRPTDVLGSIQGGSHVGLSARAADQRDAEMAQRAELAAQAEQQNAAEAAARLRYSYDALSQSRDLALRDDAAKEQALAAAHALKVGEDDALAKYREGMLKNQAERTAYLKGKPTEAKTYHVGDHLVQIDPSGGVKTLFSNAQAEKIPTVSGVPIDPLDPSLGKISALANNPILNRLMGTNAASLGTNFTGMPKVAPRAMAPAPVADVPEDLAREELDEPVEAKVLDKQTAAAFLKQAGGDKQKARQLAKDAGYSF